MGEVMVDPGPLSSDLLALRGIEKRFGGVRALRGVDLTLRPGEVHALLGENGAGKSTLIKTITGAHQPDDGTIEVCGAEVANLSPVKSRELGIACIYQKPGLFPQLSVMENIALRLEPVVPFKRVDWKKRTARARALLGEVLADIPVEAEVSSLSMPEQQLVEIACAIGAGAKIMIMDEPTACLTRREQEVLYGIVRKLCANGVGVIYISHRLEEIFALAGRVTVLRDGESVGTCAVGETNEADLIRLMVGRDVSAKVRSTNSNPGPVRLEVRNLCAGESHVSGVSFSVKSGEVLGLAGLVGAGRTELARMLFGLERVESGSILVDGKEVSLGSPADAIERGIAYVPEDRLRHGIVADIPVAQNLTLSIWRRLFRGEWLRKRAELEEANQSIARFAIRTDGPGAAAATLSGGNQQKVVLARWLATNPQILILDEPTQGVDVGTKREVYAMIDDLVRDGLAVIFISSDLPEILEVSDRIAVMREGRLVTVADRGVSAEELMTVAVGTVDGGGPK